VATKFARDAGYVYYQIPLQQRFLGDGEKKIVINRQFFLFKIMNLKKKEYICPQNNYYKQISRRSLS
jgi:hypothetical protein